MIRALKRRQEELEVAKPLQEGLDWLEKAITNCDKKMELLLEAYLAEEFPKAMLKKKKLTLEKQRTELERERRELEERLERRVIGDTQIEEIEAFCAKIRKGIKAFGFEEKRRALELLNVGGVVKDGTIYLSGYLPTGGTSKLLPTWRCC